MRTKRIFSKDEFIKTSGIDRYEAATLTYNFGNFEKFNWIDYCNNREVIADEIITGGEIIYNCYTSLGIFKIMENWTIIVGEEL